MSAPKVGDRVRVIAGQWTGWFGEVTAVILGDVCVDLCGVDFRGRTFTPDEVEVIEL